MRIFKIIMIILGYLSLFYKNRGKRVFALTFGIPMCLGFLIGFVVLCLGLYFL